MKITTAAEMREIDRTTTERFGVPSLTLMENAGTAIARFILKHYGEAGRIAVVCGKGNNGGDGFVVARHLHGAGRAVDVLLLASVSDVRGDALAMFERLPLRPIALRNRQELDSSGALAVCDLIVDAILGTGFQPPVKGFYADAITAINSSGKPVVAVDIPSGADSDAMSPQSSEGIARADAIVTFTAPRPAHVFGQLARGSVVIAPIGSPPEAIISKLNLELTTPRDFAALFAPRPADSNKGMYGHVLIVGGSLGKSGAAAMAGMAALRAGCGLSTVATPKSVLPGVAGFAAELMTEPLPETTVGSIAPSAIESGRYDELLQPMDVVAIGPGIGRNPETVQFVQEAVRRTKVPLVIDADGLNAFQGHTDLLDGHERPLVLTPHPGEMSRLAGISIKNVQANRITSARNFARQHQLVLVLKGNRTIIALPDGIAWVNPTGNPGMATGGTGDILTGMTAGITGQMQDDVARATVAAVYLHGLAGDVAAEKMGQHSLVATDLLTALPETFRRAAKSAQGDTVVIGGSSGAFDRQQLV
jgi:ADP-dependent NAD(P)H-hydrate dehydratase / NAD(P)H-hydrate epimerase